MHFQNILSKTQRLNPFKGRIKKNESLSIEHNWLSEVPTDTLRTLWVGLKNKSQEVMNLNSSDNRQIYLTIFLNRKLLTKLEISKTTLSPGEILTFHYVLKTPAKQVVTG